MQVVITVKTTIREVKKALRLLNPNLPSEFVLEIDYNTESVDTEHSQDLVMWYDRVQSDGHNQYTTEQQSQPWYPDDSGEWIETYGNEQQNLGDNDLIEVLHYTERDAQDYNHSVYLARKWKNCWGLAVAYKLVKKGN